MTTGTIAIDTGEKIINVPRDQEYRITERTPLSDDEKSELVVSLNTLRKKRDALTIERAETMKRLKTQIDASKGDMDRIINDLSESLVDREIGVVDVPDFDEGKMYTYRVDDSAVVSKRDLRIEERQVEAFTDDDAANDDGEAGDDGDAAPEPDDDGKGFDADPLDYTCERCQSEPGERCTKPNGDVADKPHKVRIELASGA